MRGPTGAEVAESAGLGRAPVREALARLSERDFLVYDAAGDRVRALYPFSDVPCPHRVQVEGEKPLYAM